MRKTDAFGQRLTALREAKGISKRELARQADLSPPAISDYERGATYPDLQKLEILADILDVSPCDLAFGHSTPSVSSADPMLKKARAVLTKALNELSGAELGTGNVARRRQVAKARVSKDRRR